VTTCNRISRNAVSAGASFAPSCACAFADSAASRFCVFAVLSLVRAKSPCALVVCRRIADWVAISFCCFVSSGVDPATASFTAFSARATAACADALSTSVALESFVTFVSRCCA
jgi:hypothetical protein